MPSEKKSVAPTPPNLRDAAEGATKRCETCHMYDDGECWGYGNFRVEPTQVCDSYAPEPKSKRTQATSEVQPMKIIATAEDLLAAIRSVTRGGEAQNEERAEIIGRARELGHHDLIPDNWNGDGTLASRSGVWEDEEQRETYNDLSRALQDCLNDQDDDDYAYCYLLDFDESTVYYGSRGCIYAAPYSVEAGGPVTIGEGERVRPVTSYVPAERAEKRSARLGVRTQEWRRERATALSDVQRKRPDRRVLAHELEVRDDEDSPTFTLRSYASLFDTPYMVGSGQYRYEETIRPSAFKRTLSRDPDVVFRTEHSGPPLARTASGTLRLGSDERGLWYEADLDKTDPDVLALIPKVRRGDLRESSFAFRATDDEWNDEFTKRDLISCELDRGDVSVVTFGASPTTGNYMTLRFQEQLQALRTIGFEAFLEAWVDWRNYTLIPPELRAGKVISSQSMDVLRNVLDLISNADDSLDDAQPLLADLMGVPNPDDDAEENSDESEEGERSAWSEVYALAKECGWSTQRGKNGTLLLRRGPIETSTENGERSEVVEKVRRSDPILPGPSVAEYELRALAERSRGFGGR